MTLQEEVTRLRADLAEAKFQIGAMQRRLPGEGVISSHGTRFDIDVSCSISSLLLRLKALESATVDTSGLMNTDGSNAAATVTFGAANLTTTGDITCGVLNYTTLNPAITVPEQRVTYHNTSSVKIGTDAGGTSNYSTFTGINAGKGAQGEYHTGMGYGCAGGLSTGMTAESYSNTMFGSRCGRYITSGKFNNGFGDYTLMSLTTGSYNQAIGGSTLYYCVSGSDNNAFGYGALLDATGDGNNAFGRTAGYRQGSGGGNCWFGQGSGYGVGGTYAGCDNNTFMGTAGAYNVISNCDSNSGFGAYSFYTLSGSGNVGLGFQSGYYETGSNKLFIDNAKRASEADARVKALVYGVFDAATANQKLSINAECYVLERLGIGTTSPTAKLSVAEKGAINADGGYMIKLTNRTGGNSVKGEVVETSSSYDNAVQKIVKDVPDPIGVFYESGIADGAEAWIVVSGIADVYFVGNTTRNHLARGFLTADGASYVTGQALSETIPTSPFASDKHFYEIGHVLESRTGAGLAKCVLHFN
jgi:hypothetical protein